MAFQKRIRFLYYLADVPLRSGKQIMWHAKDLIHLAPSRPKSNLGIERVAFLLKRGL